jgi:hypothetical protein
MFADDTSILCTAEDCNNLKLKLNVVFTHMYCIVLYLFQIPSNPYTGQRTSHKPQDIESVITIQYEMFQQKNVSA